MLAALTQLSDPGGRVTRLLTRTVAATVLTLVATSVAAPAHATDDVPAGAPAAAHRPEARLGVPDGWPFEQRLSRTSGTGRLHDGASYWSDFVYDDHGAAVPGALSPDNVAAL